MADAVPQQQDLKHFAGHFLVWNIGSDGVARKLARRQPPKRLHPTLTEASAEACRLNLLHPDCTFVVLQEVARVKMVAAAAMSAGA